MRNYNNIDIYEILCLPKNSSLEKVKERIEKFEELAMRKPTEEGMRNIAILKEKYNDLIREKQEGPNILITEQYKKEPEILITETYKDKDELNQLLEAFEPEPKRQTSYKLQKENKKRKQAKGVNIKMKAIKVIAGISVCVCALGFFKGQVEEFKSINKANNVCVEYQVQQGDTKKGLSNMFADYSIVYTEVTGPYRNIDYVYEGDVVIGRTTKEVADELVAKGEARIISIDEAIEIMEENNCLTGEFRDYKEGKSDMVFFIPESINII